MTTPVPAHGAEAQEIGDEVLVFHRELLQRLAGPAAAIWKLIDGVRNTDQIVQEIRSAFNAGEQASDDVRVFLSELEAAGLIQMERTRPGRFWVPSSVAWDRDGTRVVLADMRTGSRTALSDTATMVWELAGQGLTADEVIADLVEAYPEAPLLVPQVSAALGELVARGWLSAA